MPGRIFYVSAIALPIEHVEIQAIVSSSIVWNRQRDVTGILVATARNFAQALEARPEAIDLVIERIRGDRHHFDVRIQLDEPIRIRRFAQWSMADRIRRDLGVKLALLHGRSAPRA